MVVEGVQCCRECQINARGQTEDTELLISTPGNEEEQHVSWQDKLGASLDSGLYKVCPMCLLLKSIPKLTITHLISCYN